MTVLRVGDYGSYSPHSSQRREARVVAVVGVVLHRCWRCCCMLGFQRRCPARSPDVKRGPPLSSSPFLSLLSFSFSRAFLYDHKNRKCQWLSFDKNSSGVHSLEDFNYQLYQKKGTWPVVYSPLHISNISTIVFCFKSQTSPLAGNDLFTNWPSVWSLKRQIQKIQNLLWFLCGWTL